jgi:hypothetical protein
MIWSISSLFADRSASDQLVEFFPCNYLAEVLETVALDPIVDQITNLVEPSHSDHGVICILTGEATHGISRWDL